MFERPVRRKPRTDPTVDTVDRASLPPEPEPDAPVGFDIGSIGIFPPGAQIGPDGGDLSAPVANRIRAQQGAGAPLAPPVQRRMEAGLGHNLADVRIHADGEAEALSRGVSARAFTLGSDIFLGRDAADAGIGGDSRLLAHELTHVIQQRGAALEPV